MAKTSAPADPINQFLDKLPPNIVKEIIGNDCDASTRRRKLVMKGGEALRILKAKGAVLANKEKPGVRAGLVVDFLCRQGQVCCQTSIPVQILSEVLNVRGKKNIEQMQALVSSHLSSLQKNSNRSVQKRKLSDSSLHSSTVSSNNSTIGSPSTTTLIRDLCIQLGPMIPNAELAASYAQKLFSTLTNESNEKRHSREQILLMDDISRNQEYYEAACLFLAVQKIEGSDYQKPKAQKKKVQTKKGTQTVSITEESDEDNDEEMDEDQTLSERDIISAAKLREGMFKDTLECVNGYIQDGEVPFLTSSSALGPVSLANTVNETSSVVPEDACMLLKNRADSEKFIKWKHNTLKRAMQMHSEQSNPSADLDETELLKIAADDLLKKFDIV